MPSGPLSGLPFNALITEPPAEAKATVAAFRQAPWIIKRHAVTVLPAVSSLKALRALGQPSQAAKPFVGFGDPDFAGKGGKTRNKRKNEQVADAAPLQLNAVQTRGLSDFFRGGLADADALRQGLPPLPDTANELRTIATTLNAEESDVILGSKATETTIKAMSTGGQLASYQVVAFATHGLVAGELQGLAEPAIALTVPAKASEADDGLLTASEAANLKLDADWVILSACNTAAGGAPDAQALSGLSRAFFYAGSRALLVSHWKVDSAAAVKLTTGTFAALKETPALGGSGAFRASMLTLINKGDPYEAHPAYWAPFFVVGEGGAR